MGHVKPNKTVTKKELLNPFESMALYACFVRAELHIEVIPLDEYSARPRRFFAEWHRQSVRNLAAAPPGSYISPKLHLYRT